jgi:glutamine synthetase type III
MFKRIKNLWKLSKKDPKALKVLESLTDEQLKAVPEEVKGDGKAVFLGEGTHEEWEELQKEDKGLKAWYEVLRSLK